MRIVISIFLIALVLGTAAASMQPGPQSLLAPQQLALNQAPQQPAPNPAPQVPPTIRVQNCTTSGCHSDQTGGKFLHAPTAAGACEMCHITADEAKHTFTLKHQGAELCNFCHLGKSEAPGMHVHAPVQQGKCTECHSPHGSDHRYLIKGETTGAMCLTCHESILKDRAHVHTPIAQGDCMGCHKAHSSILPGLLVEQGRALCLRCHASVETNPAHALPRDATTAASAASPAVLATHDQATATSPAQALAAALTVHEPFKGECTQCHEQHASSQLALLKQEPKQLCISCHQDIAAKLADAVVQHSAVTVDRACLNCHSPHVAHEPGLLRDAATTLCLECHNKPIVKADGVTIQSLAEMTAQGQHLHNPVTTGGCGKCHDVHGGEHAALLNQPYSQSFYQSFSVEAYGLCFTCHDSKLATEPTTNAATNFRNGETNLHYVHVTAQGEAGRSCRVCHDTHSAKNAKQLRESVTFGNWQVPITFEASTTGGSCAAGCHRARTYNRVTATVFTPPQ